LGTLFTIVHSSRATRNHISNSQVESFMRSFKRKSLGLTPISAVVLLGANGAFAAEFAFDAQMQARDLLSGTVGGVRAASVSYAIPADGKRAFNADPQEQARQLILGKRDGAGIGHRASGTDFQMTSVREPHRAAADAQESARRLLLGMGV
jgi:hypothetical protein